MSRRGPFLRTAAASALGFAVIAWVSTAGSVQVLQTSTATASPPPLPHPTPERQTGGTANQTPLPSGARGPDLDWIELLTTALLLSVALIGAALLARWAWRKRWHRLHRQPVVPFEVLPEVPLALAHDAPTQFATLQEGSPRNAIVACWLRLEEVAREAGAPPDPAETSTEFTTRVLGTLAFDPPMINGFAGLYREARFSDHELGESARRAAVAALHSLYDDLGTSGRLISPMSDQRVPWIPS